MSEVLNLISQIYIREAKKLVRLESLCHIVFSFEMRKQNPIKKGTGMEGNLNIKEDKTVLKMLY